MSIRIPCTGLAELLGRVRWKNGSAGQERYSGGWPATRVAQTLEEADRFMPMTEPKLFGLSRDTTHLNLAGCDGAGPLSRVLKSANYRGWICVDLDTARRGPRADFERSGPYVVNKLEPVYA